MKLVEPPQPRPGPGQVLALMHAAQIALRSESWSRLAPTAPAFRHFQPHPFDQGHDEETNVGRSQGETRNEVAAPVVPLTEQVQAPATPGDLGEATVVSADEMVERARDRFGKG